MFLQDIRFVTRYEEVRGNTKSTITTGNDPTIDLGVTMPWPDLGVVCCLSGVPGEVRERSFWLKEVSLSLTCSGYYYYH